MREPASLAEWADCGLGEASLPWLGEEAGRKLQRSISYFLLDNEFTRNRRKSRSAALRWGWSLLRRPLHWRLRRDFFRWPVELWISMARQWLVMRRSLLTGDALSRSLTETR